MELLPVPISEVSEILDLMRGKAIGYATENTNYRTKPPTLNAQAAKGHRIERRCKRLLFAVRDLEAKNEETLYLPDDWNLPDVEAAVAGLKAVVTLDDTLEDEEDGEEGPSLKTHGERLIRLPRKRFSNDNTEGGKSA